jgi:signal transduction histidine kinase
LRQHLFEAFATTKEDGGIGLGLYMSQLIVAYHNGRIAALDRVGGGTRFEVSLPPIIA